MIQIQFDLKDMNNVSLQLGDTVRHYSDICFSGNGKLKKRLPKHGITEGVIHWHNGSGGMFSNGIVVNRVKDNKFEEICTYNPNSKNYITNDDNSNVCWYIEKLK